MDRMEIIKEEAKKILKERIFIRKSIELTDRDRIHSYLYKILKDLLRRQKIDLSEDDTEQMCSQILADIFGLGSLEQLFKDPLITDILVNNPGQIFIEKEGEIIKLDAKFNSPEEIRTIIDRMMMGTGRRIDRTSPFADFRLPDGSRVTAIIPPISTSPAICVRKFSHEVLGPDSLLKLGTLNKKSLGFLEVCVKARLNILITGPTGTGKTTLLNALIRFISPNERMVVIEDTEELFIQESQHSLKLLSRPPNIEGKGEISLYDLLKLSLHLRPDRIIVGEVRGEETFYFLQAMNTGHEGSMCTLHANDAQDALARLETLGLMAKPNIQAQVIRRFLSRGIDLIVHLRKTVEGKRVISQISEVLDQEDVFGVKDIFLRKQRFDKDKEAGDLEFNGYIPSFINKLKARTGVGEEILR